MKAENPVHDRKRECINYEHVFITERKKLIAICLIRGAWI